MGSVRGFPLSESQSAFNSWISSIGELRQTSREPWVDTARDRPRLLCGVFFEIDSYNLLDVGSPPHPRQGPDSPFPGKEGPHFPLPLQRGKGVFGPTGKQLSRTIWSSFNKERMLHLCDSTVASLTARTDNVVASKCEYPPFRYVPFNCARS